MLQNNNTIKTISLRGKDGKDLPIQSRWWEQECNIPVGAVPVIREKKRRKNPIAPKTAIKEVHENAEEIMKAFDELKSNQFEDSKDGVVGNA